MSALKKIPFDLAVIAETFKLERSGKCIHLENWLNGQFELSINEQQLLDEVYAEMLQSANYLNEEEIKIRLIAPLFQIAHIEEENNIRVFFERSLSAVIGDVQISVVCDCMVAASTIFKTPTHPYFFLQEFKKAKGEKRDPEAQMLLAMLAAQSINKDDQPIYGGFLIGSVWQLTTLVGKEYCTSRPYYASNRADLQQLVFSLRQLKHLIKSR
jgi:hypothetical protein